MSSFLPLPLVVSPLRRGFTLVEVMLAVGLLAVLAAVALPSCRA